MTVKLLIWSYNNIQLMKICQTLNQELRNDYIAAETTVGDQRLSTTNISWQTQLESYQKLKKYF